jgi:RNA polymerase sigma-70 factor (ECF subfamily)
VSAEADGALVSRFLARRDERAFTALYERHTPLMYGLSLRLAAGEEPEARDVVQEAWVRAIAGLATFRGESRLSSWLCGICANVWRERLRRTRPEVALDAASEGAALPSPAPPHEPLDVRRALEGLAPGYRAVIVLHGIYGYSHAEVAAMLGIAEGTSKSQLLRGRRALRLALGEAETEERA